MMDQPQGGATNSENLYFFFFRNGRNLTKFGAHVLGITNKNLCVMLVFPHIVTPAPGLHTYFRSFPMKAGGCKWEIRACKYKTLQALRWSIKSFIGVKSSLNCYFGLAKPEIHQLLFRGLHSGQLNCFFPASKKGGGG